MRRREFITLIGAALGAYPLTVGAQQNERARRIAVLVGVEDDAEGQARLAAFRKGMHDLGCLVSYGIDNHDLWQKAAGYVDRILKGAEPAELPVQEPTKFVLAINLKAAKALDLTVAPALLARADEVIE